MQAEEIRARVNKTIKEHLYVEDKDITPEASFTEDLGADSLDQVGLIMEIEKEFNISIPDEQAENLLTVGQVYTLLDSYLLSHQ